MLENFYDPTFMITSIEEEIINLTIRIESRQITCICPACYKTSNKVHSRYERKARDLSILGKEVKLIISTKKFFCINNNCEKKIFTETFDDFFLKYSRITERLKKSILAIAFNTSARGATKICEIIFSKFSKDTIIRLLMKFKINVFTDYKFIGVDDWAFRKGSSYGTIICDILTHKPIELLGDRSTKTLSDLIKIILDDNFPKGLYINKDIETTTIIDEIPPIEIEVVSGNLTSAARKKLHLVNECRRLKDEGYTSKEIIKMLGISKKTVSRYLNRISALDCAHPERGSSLDEYKKIIEEELIKATKPKDILSIIRPLGYDGSDSNLRMYLFKLKKKSSIASHLQKAIEDT